MTRLELFRVLLVGFMGSGKTSVGRDLAGRLGWRFVDFDEAIEVEEGRSVASIFAAEGEPYFREVEERVEKALERCLANRARQLAKAKTAKAKKASTRAANRRSARAS